MGRPGAPDAPSPFQLRPFLSEDWAATIVGLLLLGLALGGVITRGMVP
ncbi:MAG TPA: hypothetical protein VNO86_01390 [Candidatus Binatia bacterium]|nr:hypothetical protein [Candidatus Binatia bacterium]